MFKYIKKYFVTLREVRKAEKIAKTDLFYKDLNEIPLFNWWKCKEGELIYLWKKQTDYVPYFFKRVFSDMYFQLDYIDTEELRKELQTNIYYNKYLTTNDIKWKRKADSEKAKVDLFKSVETKEAKLNDMIKNVQRILNINYFLNPKEISAGYFFNLYNDAKNIAYSHGDN